MAKEETNETELAVARQELEQLKKKSASLDAQLKNQSEEMAQLRGKLAETLRERDDVLAKFLSPSQSYAVVGGVRYAVAHQHSVKNTMEDVYKKRHCNEDDVCLVLGAKLVD